MTARGAASGEGTDTIAANASALVTTMLGAVSGDGTVIMADISTPWSTTTEGAVSGDGTLIYAFAPPENVGCAEVGAV